MQGTPASVGGYALEKLLGQGGMGAVYRARDPRTGRTVALKVLRDLEPGGTRRARFEREATLLARVQSPFVVAVHASGEDPRIGPFFVMELVEGASLRALVEKGPVAPADAARIGAQVARGLGVLHEAGVIHRDVKPENVIVAPGRGAVLVDLGIGKDLESSVALTRSRAIVGTPHYVPPEALRAGASQVSERSDLYSLGAVLFELVSGRPPYGGTTAIEVFEAALEAPVPALPRAPADLAAVVARCLEKEPLRRYASAAELAGDLDLFLAGKRTRALEALQRRRRGRGAGLALVAGAAIVALGVGAVFVERRAARRASVRALVAEAEGTDTRQHVSLAALEALRARRSVLATTSPAELAGVAAALDARLAVLDACARLDDPDAARALAAGCELLDAGDAPALDRALAAIATGLDLDPRRACDALERACARAPSPRCERLLARGRIALATSLRDPDAARALLARARAAAPASFDDAALAWAKDVAARPEVHDLDRALELGRDFLAAVPDSSATRDDVSSAVGAILLARAGKRRDRGNLAGAIDDRIAAFDASPKLEAPPWYPGLVGRLAADTATPDALRARAALEAFAEGADGGWTLATVVQLENLTAYASQAEQRLAEVALRCRAHEFVTVLDAVDHDFDKEWEESPPRYRHLARALALRDWDATRERPRPDPLPGDPATECLSAALTLRPDRESEITRDLVALLDRGRELAKARWVELAEASRRAPDDRDVQLSEKLARRHVCDVLEVWGRMVLELGRAHAGRPERPRISELGVPPIRDALELCPPEPEFRSLQLRSIEVELVRYAEGPRGAIEAAERGEKDPEFHAALEDPASVAHASVSGTYYLCLWRARSDLDLSPPRVEDAELMLPRLEKLSPSVFLDNEHAEIDSIRERIAKAKAK